MAPKILLVVTNHDQLGNTGKKTGWYLPEVAHPCHVFKKEGFEVVFMSPKGGKAPLDPGSVDASKGDEVCKAFLADAAVMADLDNTKKPSDIKPSDFQAIVYAGGHGPMWDLPDNKEIGKLGAQIYEAGGVAAAVCHGVVGFIPVTLSNGQPLVKGSKITCFTNSEETAVQLMEVVPFALESRLKEQGGSFVAGSDWASNVVVSGNIVTGQNPASATGMAEEVAKILKK